MLKNLSYMLQVFILFFLASCMQPNKSAVKSGQEEQTQTAKMKYVLHKADSRGSTNVGWLDSRHTFTFNDYYDPDRMNFGALRVFNDDFIAAGSAFPMHPHRDMEIITIPLHGSVKHSDNMGNAGVIKAGDVQIMSAGTGIRHSEANNSAKDSLRLFQVWVIPNKQSVTPRYQQKNGVLQNIPKNSLKTLVSPNDTNAVFLYQDAVFKMGKYEKGKKFDYKPAFTGNGVYAFIVEGSAVVNGISVNRRDGIGIWQTDNLHIESKADLQILLMDVPMIE